MKSNFTRFVSILALAAATFAFSGCVVAPVGPPPRMVVAPAPVIAVAPPPVVTVAPPGVVYVAPTYAMPAPGYVWAYHARYGWGWHHPQYGWHQGWR